MLRQNRKTNVLSSEGRRKIYFDYAESRKTTNVIEQKMKCLT